MRSTATLLGTLAITAALGLSGCGSDGSSKKPSAGASYAARPVGQIESDAVAAMSKVGSLHIKGRVVVADEGALTIDVNLTRRGDCSGYFDLEGLGRADLLQVDGAPYLRWSKELWNHVGGDTGITAEAIAGRWVDAHAQSDLFDSMCNLDKFVSGLEESPDPDEDEVVGPSTYYGAPTVKIRASYDEGMATAQIAAESPHYLVRMDLGGDQFVEFSDFDKPVTVKAPAKDEILDLSSLSG